MSKRGFSQGAREDPQPWRFVPFDTVPAGPLIRAARLSVGMGKWASHLTHGAAACEEGTVVPCRHSVQQAVAEEMEAWRQKSHQVPETDALFRRLEAPGTFRFAVDANPAGRTGGKGRARLRPMLAGSPQLHRQQPRGSANCILFIDEIDAVGRIARRPAWAAAARTCAG